MKRLVVEKISIDYHQFILLKNMKKLYSEFFSFQLVFLFFLRHIVQTPTRFQDLLRGEGGDLNIGCITCMCFVESQ